MAAFQCLKVLLDALLASSARTRRPRRPRETAPVGRA
jgi:hypothetical protein